MTELILRGASIADAPAIHRLIVQNLEVGHLLPRSLEDVAAHAQHFVVADAGGLVIGCAELVALSEGMAEVRSLVVAEDARGRGIGPRLVRELAEAGIRRGFATLCAFTHDPSPFVRLGFSLVPHTWVPEKIARDCNGCALFRRCGQYAVALPLRGTALVSPEQAVGVVHAARGGVRRSSVERLHLRPVQTRRPAHDVEAVPA